MQIKGEDQSHQQNRPITASSRAMLCRKYSQGYPSSLLWNSGAYRIMEQVAQRYFFANLHKQLTLTDNQNYLYSFDFQQESNKLLQIELPNV